MSFLLKARFNKDGCSTDSGITSITPSAKANIYTEPSCLKNGDTCVFFPPYNYEVGLKKKATITIGKDKPFTVYLKYKIDQNLLDDEYNVPIITYANEAVTGEPDLNLTSLTFRDADQPSSVTGNTGTASQSSSIGVYNYFLFIQKKEYFSILLNKEEGFSSRIAYTFDNKWHTLCITRDSQNKVRFFIDGHLSTTNDSDGGAITLGNTIYFGKYKPQSNVSVSLDGGYLDDICILDTCVYTDNFIPPTMYFTGEDSKENYKYYNFSNMENMTRDVQRAVEEKMFSTATHINNRQMGWLPRRLRIRWYQHTRQYFRNEEYQWTPPRPDATVINLYGLEIPYIYGYDRYRFVEGNVYRLWQQNKILPFLLFVDGRFVKLSDIDMVKSDWWLTIFIKGRDPRFYPRIKNIELIIIPFPIIYEEGLGEREDLTPLYSFNDQGLFDSSNGYTFFYIDKYKAPSGLTSIGILDQFIPTVAEDNEDGEDKYTDSMFMHNIWRYGTLSLQSTNGDAATYKFNCTSDSKYVQPGDQINLYMHTLYISPDRYRVTGNDLIEFYDYKDINVDNFVVTMQMITDNREWELYDLTNTRFEEVVAEVDNQSVFNIPEVVDDDGYVYRYFLIFRGSVCIMNTDRYVISDDYSTLTFTNSDDFVPKGTKLYFVFVKLLKADQFGPLHVKPIFLSTIVDTDEANGGDNYTYEISIPDLHGLDYNVNNVMLFIQDTFISPERYVIDNNVLRLTKYTGDMFYNGKHATFVLLKMVNRFEDPIDDHDRVVQEQIQRGRRYVLYELPIPKRQLITIDNFVTFDNEGYYIPNLFGEVMNRNIIKELHSDNPMRVVPRYLTCVYSTDSLPNEANTLIPTNDDYVSGYITLREEYYELDDHFEEFMSDFDVSYTKNIHYGQNLARALDYMVCYNQNKLDKAYERLSLMDRFTYDTKSFIDMLLDIDNDTEEPDRMVYRKENALQYYQFYINGIDKIDDENGSNEDNLKYYMELDREVYQDMYYDSFPIYFVNGLVPNWYQYTLYANNRMTIRMEEKPLETDSIELFLFRKIHNYLYKLDNMINYNAPTLLIKDLDGTLEIPKFDWYKDILTNCSFTYQRGEFVHNLDGQIVIEKNYIDSTDPKYNIDGTLNLGLNEWTDNTEPGYGTIDGSLNISKFEWNDDSLGIGIIDGTLEYIIPMNYLKENILQGYEFIDNTVHDYSSIDFPVKTIEFTAYTDEFTKSEWGSEYPELGNDQYDYIWTGNIKLDLSSKEDFFNKENNYWYGYTVDWINPTYEYSNVSDYDINIPNDQDSDEITINDCEVYMSFYTNEDEDTYKVPVGTYEYTMKLNMTSKLGVTRTSSITFIMHVEERIVEDLNLISLEFHDAPKTTQTYDIGGGVQLNKELYSSDDIDIIGQVEASNDQYNIDIITGDLQYIQSQNQYDISGNVQLVEPIEVMYIPKAINQYVDVMGIDKDLLIQNTVTYTANATGVKEKDNLNYKTNCVILIEQTVHLQDAIYEVGDYSKFSITITNIDTTIGLDAIANKLINVHLYVGVNGNNGSYYDTKRFCEQELNRGSTSDTPKLDNYARIVSNNELVIEYTEEPMIYIDPEKYNNYKFSANQDIKYLFYVQLSAVDTNYFANANIVTTMEISSIFRKQ